MKSRNLSSELNETQRESNIERPSATNRDASTVGVQEADNSHKKESVATDSNLDEMADGYECIETISTYVEIHVNSESVPAESEYIEMQGYTWKGFIEV